MKRLRSLKAGRGADALILLEGHRLIEEALDSGVVVAEAAIAPSAERDELTRAVAARLAASGVPVRRVSDDVMDALAETETSPGLLALARRPVFDEEALYSSLPLIVVAVSVQNPGNVGGLLRTAEAAGATGVYLTRGTADPLSWKGLRGSMGSAFRLPHVSGELDSILASLRQRRVRTVASVIEGAAYNETDLTGPLALLMGSEGSGLPPEATDAADVRVTIPMAGRVESLNVGVAAGLLLFEAARQRRAKASTESR